MDKERLNVVIRKHLPEAVDLLSAIIACPSTPGKELEAMQLLEERLVRLQGNTTRIEMDNGILKDPDYSSPIPDLDYTGHFNLRTEWEGSEPEGRTLLFNVHMDVVEPSEGMRDAFVPKIKDGILYGRGACDDKGPLTCLYLVLLALNECRYEFPGKVICHFVVEEENGGNGSLAMVRKGEKADACMVLEPSNGSIFTSVRGAVWFKLVCHGKAGHSGNAGVTNSALLKAHQAMSVLTRYHAALLESSRGDPLFDIYTNPMPLTFGRLVSGNWPAAAPNRAVLEGVLGFLPNKTKEAICQEMRNALEKELDWNGEDYDLSFTYRHDCSVVDPAHPLPQALLDASKETGHPLKIAAFSASCDAWFYNNLAKIPTVVYGPGNLGYAHSKDEQIAIEDICIAAENILSGILKFNRQPS